MKRTDWSLSMLLYCSLENPPISSICKSRSVVSDLRSETPDDKREGSPGGGVLQMAIRAGSGNGLPLEAGGAKHFPSWVWSSRKV